MTDAVRAMFRAQAAGCESLGSALTARVLRLLAMAMTPGHAIEDRVLHWQGDLSRLEMPWRCGWREGCMGWS